MDELNKLYEETMTKLRAHLEDDDLVLAEKYTYAMLRRARLFRSIRNTPHDTIIEQLEAGGIEFFTLISELTVSMAEQLQITEYGLNRLHDFSFPENFTLEDPDCNTLGFTPVTEVGEILLVMSEVIGRFFGMIEPSNMIFTHRYRPDWHRHFLHNYKTP